VEVIDRVLLDGTVNPTRPARHFFPRAARDQGKRAVCRALHRAAIIGKLGRVEIAWRARECDIVTLGSRFTGLGATELAGDRERARDEVKPLSIGRASAE